MELISTAFSKFQDIHPLLKIGIGACSLLTIRQIASKLGRIVFSIPNGPEGFPIVGIIPYMISSSPLQYMAYTLSNYGPITCYSLGLKRIFLINDPLLAKKIYANPLTLSKQVRGKTDANPLGLLNGIVWKNRRKILYSTIISSLKTSFIANGTKTFFKHKISDIINQHCDHSKSLDLGYILKPLSFNIIFFACFGQYLSSLNDKFWIVFQQKANKHTSNTLIRILKSSFFGEKGWIDHEWNQLLSYLKTYVTENNMLNNKDSIYYKLKIKKEENNMCELDIISEILGLFIGATEATSTTMHFIILLLCKYPQIQNKIYNELKALQCEHNIGIDLNGKNLVKMPLLRSFIHETMRLYPVTIATAPRAIRKAFVVDNVVTLCGKIKSYNIPKDCLLQINTIGISRNCKYWSGNKNINMDELHLEFWLNDEGKFVLNKDGFTLFSIGKRDCIGRGLAIKQMYIVMSCLILQYRFYVEHPSSFKIEGKAVKGPLIPIQSMPVFVTKRN